MLGNLSLGNLALGTALGGGLLAIIGAASVYQIDGANQTQQYSYVGAAGWSVLGSGASIDGNGLLTVDARLYDADNMANNIRVITVQAENAGAQVIASKVVTITTITLPIETSDTGMAFTQTDNTCYFQSRNGIGAYSSNGTAVGLALNRQFFFGTTAEQWIYDRIDLAGGATFSGSFAASQTAAIINSGVADAEWYYVEINVSSFTSGNLQLYLGVSGSGSADVGSTASSAGVYRFVAQHASGEARQLLVRGGPSGFNGTFSVTLRHIDHLTAANLVVDGDMQSDAGWTFAFTNGVAPISVENGIGTVTTTPSTRSELRQAFSTEIGAEYLLEGVGTVVSGPSSGLQASLGTVTGGFDVSPGPSITSGVPYKLTFVATSTTTHLTLRKISATASEAQFGPISIRKLEDLTPTAELVTNGGFDADTDWIKDTGWTIGSGVATCDGTTGDLTSDATLTADNWYRLQFDLNSGTAGAIQAQAGGTFTGVSVNHTSTGTYSGFFQAPASGLFSLRSNAFDGSIDNVQLIELPGGSLAAAQAPTNSDRPTMGADSIGSTGTLNITIPTGGLTGPMLLQEAEGLLVEGAVDFAAGEVNILPYLQGRQMFLARDRAITAQERVVLDSLLAANNAAPADMSGRYELLAAATSIDFGHVDASAVTTWEAAIKNSGITSVDFSTFTTSTAFSVREFARAATSLVTVNLSAEFVEYGQDWSFAFFQAGAVETITLNGGSFSRITSGNGAFETTALNQSTVDAILAAAVSGGQAGIPLELQGSTSSPPSAAGWANYETLVARGWSVFVNGTPPANSAADILSISSTIALHDLSIDESTHTATSGTGANAGSGVVGFIRDLTGNGHDLVAPADINRATRTLTADGWALVPNKADPDYYEFATQITTAEYVAVAILIPPGYADYESILAAAVGTNNNNVRTFFAPDDVIRQNNPNDFDTGAGGATLVNGVTSNAFVPGASFVLEVDGGDASEKTFGTLFGPGNASASRYGSMHLYGLVICNAVPSAAERTRIREYLASLSGVTLS